MKSVRSLKKKISDIHDLWEKGDINAALAATEELHAMWPGNERLLIMWAQLVQLQEEPENSLDAVKKMLREVSDVDEGNSRATLELAHFLDAVEDNPRIAAKKFAKAEVSARRQLIDALLGKARALAQINNKERAMESLAEAIHLMRRDGDAKKNGKLKLPPAIMMFDANGPLSTLRIPANFADEVESLIDDLRDVAVRER